MQPIHGPIDRRFDLPMGTVEDTIGKKVEAALSETLKRPIKLEVEAGKQISFKYFDDETNQGLIGSRGAGSLPFANLSLYNPSFEHPTFGKIQTVGIYVYADDQEIRNRIYSIMASAIFDKPHIINL